MNDDCKIIHGNCLEKLTELPSNSIDAIITDPPYELGFMGKKWDNTGVAYNVELWKECLRVLKHGGHLLSFGGTRTYHRMTCAIEDAGFEIRDCVFWTYGSGFPKSLNLGKAYDKLKGNDREVIGSKKGQGNIPNDRGNWGLKPNEDVVVDKGTSEWEGWGTALKPAVEPIVMARKPLKEKTIVENVIKWGVGGINIDESRIGFTEEGEAEFLNKRSGSSKSTIWQKESKRIKLQQNTQGRFPANLIWTHHPDCSENECVEGCPSKEFDKAGVSFGGKRNNLVIRQEDSSSYGGKAGNINTRKEHNDTGTPARFFKSFSYEQEDLDYAPFYYCAKASKSERCFGLNGTYILKTNVSEEKKLQIKKYLEVI